MTLNLELSGAASAEAVSLLTTQFGKLPGAYTAFLSKFDGLVPQDNAIAGTGHNDVGMTVRSFLLASAIPALASGVEALPQNCLPFAEDNSGNLFCIQPDHSITFWDHETGLLLPVAENFDDFLERLEPFDATTIEIDRSRIISAWIDPAFKSKLR
jgi:hypothetical protein